MADASLSLLDNRTRHAGLLNVHLREAVASIPRDVTAEPSVSIDIEAQVSDAPHLLSESVRSPIESATPGQDFDHDIVESLERVVHVIKTVAEKSPETSEVRVWMSSYSGGISQGCADILFAASPLRKYCLASHVFGVQCMERYFQSYLVQIMISCPVRPLGNMMGEQWQFVKSSFP